MKYYLQFQKFMLAATFVAATTSAGPVMSGADSPHKHFLQGKALIEKNCGDCMGGTRSGLEEGIAEVLKAIELGYTDSVGAYKLLAEAYNILRFVYAKRDPQEREAIRQTQQETYEKLMDLAPHDPEVFYEYAMALKNRDDRIPIYRKILKIDPRYSPARYSLGLWLVEHGQVEEGLDHAIKSIEYGDSAFGYHYSGVVKKLLTDHGRPGEAERLSKEVQRKIDEARKRSLEAQGR